LELSEELGNWATGYGSMRRIMSGRVDIRLIK